MSALTTLLENTLRTGTSATLATTLAAAICGEIENRSPLAPINAVSHIPWGDEAASHDEPSWKYTATGLGLNAGAVTGWAAIYEWLHGQREDQKNLAGILVDGAIVSALAFVTDYYLVPRRLTPGFELRLSNGSLWGIYAALALSLSAGSLMNCCESNS